MDGYCSIIEITDGGTCTANGGTWYPDPSTGTPTNSGSSNAGTWFSNNGAALGTTLNGVLTPLLSFGLGLFQSATGKPVTGLPTNGGTPNTTTAPNPTTTQNDTIVYVIIAIVVVVILLAALYLFKKNKIAK